MIHPNKQRANSAHLIQSQSPHPHTYAYKQLSLQSAPHEIHHLGDEALVALPRPAAQHLAHTQYVPGKENISVNTQQCPLPNRNVAKRIILRIIWLPPLAAIKQTGEKRTCSCCQSFVCTPALKCSLPACCGSPCSTGSGSWATPNTQ